MSNTTPELDETLDSAWGVLETIGEIPTPTEGDVVETIENKTEDVVEPKATETVETKEIVKAEGENESAFNLRKIIAQKQAEKAGKSPEEQALIQKEIRQLRYGFKDIAKQESDHKLNETIAADYESPEELEYDSLKVAELARKNGFISKDELAEFLPKYLADFNAQQQAQNNNTQALYEFLDSKPEFKDDLEADAFVDFVNDTGIQWEKYTPNQVKQLLNGFYIAEYGNKAVNDDIKKAIEVNTKIQSQTFSGGSVSKSIEADPVIEDAWKSLGK